MADKGQSKPKTILWHDIDGSRHRRPAGAMTLHQQVIVGRILSAIQASPIVPGLVKVDLMFVEEELADWVAEEAAAAGAENHPRGGGAFAMLDPGSLPNEDSSFLESPRSEADCCEMLETLEIELKAAYPSCYVLRRQLRTLHKAIRTIEYSTDRG